jgi:hypothetical protein
VTWNADNLRIRFGPNPRGRHTSIPASGQSAGDVLSYFLILEAIALGVHNAKLNATSASGFKFAFNHVLRFFVVGVNLRFSNLKGEPQPIFPQATLKNQRLLWLVKTSSNRPDIPLSASRLLAG